MDSGIVPFVRISVVRVLGDGIVHCRKKSTYLPVRERSVPSFRRFGVISLAHQIPLIGGVLGLEADPRRNLAQNRT